MVSVAYDAAGHLVSQVAVVDGASYTTSWQDETLGRMAYLTYPDGLQLQYAYDAYGRLSAINRLVSSQWTPIANDTLYEPATKQL